MTTSSNREHILRLLKSYTANPSTEEMLRLVAEPNGMLEACKWLTQQSGANDHETKKWIDGACHDHKVKPLKFLSEIQHILSLFTPIHATDLSLYALFDLQPGASREAVKQRYRQLCRRYHPDTATGGTGANEQRTEAFITITKAYHTLLSREEENNQPAPAAMNHQWRQQSTQENRNELKRKNILWFSILAIVLAVISVLAAKTYNTHVMMTGLRNKGTAFVPPQKKTVTDGEKAGRRTPSSQERIKVHSSPEKAADPAPLATATAAHLTIDSEKPAVAGVTAPSQSAVLPEPLSPHLPLSPPGETAPQKQEGSVPAVSESRPTKQPTPTQVTLNKGAEQAAPGSDLQLSRAKESVISTSRPEEKPVNKSLAAQPPTMPAKENPKIDKKGEPVTISLPASNNQHLVPQSAQKVAHSSPGASLEQQTQKQIETFLQDYVTAYQQKNLLAFSRFFALDATENGKSLKDVLTDYTQLFEATESLRLGISLLNWQQNKTILNLHGRFTIALMYKGGQKTQGRGTIDFQLADNRGKWEIKALTYAFDE